MHSRSPTARFRRGVCGAPSEERDDGAAHPTWPLARCQAARTVVAAGPDPDARINVEVIREPQRAQSRPVVAAPATGEPHRGRARPARLDGARHYTRRGSKPFVFETRSATHSGVTVASRSTSTCEANARCPEESCEYPKVRHHVEPATGESGAGWSRTVVTAATFASSSSISAMTARTVPSER